MRASLAALGAALAATAVGSMPWLGVRAAGGVVLPTGQTVEPAGRITPLQVFPTGAAVSPDGRTVLAIAGRPATVKNVPAAQVVAVDAATGAIRQTLRVNDAFQSVLYTPDGAHAYVAGGSDQVVHAFDVDAAGVLTAAPDVAVPGCNFVSGLARTGDGAALWAACPQSGVVVRVPLGGGATSAVAVPNPDMLALSPDSRTLYASNWRGSSVAAVDTATLAVTEYTVGDHPTALAALPDGRVAVADANDATLATIDPAAGTVALTDLAQVGRGSDSPNGLAVAPDGRLYVTLGADNAVAVLAPRHAAVDDIRPGHAVAPWHVVGLVPTGWYPTAVALSPDGGTVHVVTARGLAQSAAATAPYVTPDPAAAGIDGAYFTVGTLETLAAPDARTLQAQTATVRDGIALRTPAGDDGGNPVLLGPAGPIKHVIYVTRENKTYDADLGDLHPGAGNGLVLFGQSVTPNLHALERGFSEAQQFFYPGHASDVGHMWEDAGGVADIMERGVEQEGLDSDWTTATNYPSTGLLVEQAWRQGLSVRTYNEELAQQSGLLPQQYQADPSVYPDYDLHYPDAAREQGWETEFSQFERHSCGGALAATYGSNCQLPALEYVYLGGDHTTVVDEPGYPTVEAQVADNDYATGRLIDAVSHSADWASTLVVVVEDDPQGTGDHLSAYHGFVAVASPYIRRGYVSTVHYELPSIVGAIDRILGLVPLTDFAAESRPLDDIFTPHADLTPFSADASGVQLYPFTPLPGVPPSADPTHGVLSFARPDATVPAVTNDATWLQLRGMTEQQYLATRTVPIPTQ
ncbi:MAG TPA: hypothetical protein VFC09_11745 [Candidatus Dormibacteraeota bacterium]|nr:hypothetical protein [Candidatus Dormibacteraeota bacterium]